MSCVYKPLIDCSSNASWASTLTWLDNYWLDLRPDLKSRPATRDSTRTRALSDSRLDSTREYATCKQVCWPLMMSDYPLVVPRVFCYVNGGNHIQHGFPLPCCWIRHRILYVKINVICHQWRRRRVGRLLGGSASMATFQHDVQLTACYKNILTGPGRCNNKRPIGILTPVRCRWMFGCYLVPIAGHLDSRISIQWVILITTTVALIYSSTQVKCSLQITCVVW